MMLYLFIVKWNTLRKQDSSMMTVISVLVYISAVVVVNCANSDNVLMAKEFGHHICPDGDAVDQVYPDGLRYTCKQGPGKFVKCTSNLRYKEMPFTCPDFGYYSGWHPVDSLLYVNICCTQKGLQYSLKDCEINPDDFTNRGEILSIGKGKVTIGSQFIGGRWVGLECAYNKYTYNKNKEW